MPTVEYYYPRALELEGRHPSDAGVWPQTVHRLEVGEGLPFPDTSWALVTFLDQEPIPASRRPPSSVLWRNFYYRRIRSSAECDRHMLFAPQSLVRVAFQLTAAWASAQGGMIPVPSEEDTPIPLTHAAVFINRIPDKRLFQFQVKWSNWGDQGTGTMPHEYFDRYVFECWAAYGRPNALKNYLEMPLEEGRVSWSAQDEESRPIYAFEVRDSALVERFAWTFVIERDGVLEVEELYVRPEYRRLGYGGWLADRVAQLVQEKGMPLRLWVGFADCKAECAENYLGVVATAHRLGVQFQQCSVPWAAYFATTEQPGEMLPIEPATIPSRPRTQWKELMAFVVALGLEQVSPKVNGVRAISSVGTAVVPDISSEHFPEIGTEAWGQKNQRRAELIRKKNRAGLDPRELQEYEELQRLSLAALERAFPSPMKGAEELERLKAQLHLMPDANAE